MPRNQPPTSSASTLGEDDDKTLKIFERCWLVVGSECWPIICLCHVATLMAMTRTNTTMVTFWCAPRLVLRGSPPLSRQVELVGWRWCRPPPPPPPPHIARRVLLCALMLSASVLPRRCLFRWCLHICNIYASHVRCVLLTLQFAHKYELSSRSQLSLATNDGEKTYSQTCAAAQHAKLIWLSPHIYNGCYFRVFVI